MCEDNKYHVIPTSCQQQIRLGRKRGNPLPLFLFSMKKRIFLSIVFSAILVATAYVGTAEAQNFKLLLGPLVPECGKNNICTVCDIFKLIENILNFFYTVTSIMATLTLAWGGFLMIMPYLGGGQAMAERGKSIIKGSFIAILIIFFAWLGIDTILKIVGQTGGVLPAQIKNGGITYLPWYKIVCVAPKIEVTENRDDHEPPDNDVGKKCDLVPGTTSVEFCSTSALGDCPGSRSHICECTSWDIVTDKCLEKKWGPFSTCKLDTTKGPCDPKKPKLNGKLGDYDGYDKETLDKQLAEPPEGTAIKANEENVICNISALRDYNETIDNASRDYGVSSNRIKAIIIVESGGRPGAQSRDNDSKSSYGLMQIRPETARGYDLTLTSDSDAIEKLKDPYYNIWLGTKYYSDLQKRYKGDKGLASAAYNGGPAANRDSVDCPGKKRWQCEWDNTAHTLRNERPGHPGYGITRRYIPKVQNTENAISQGSEGPCI